MGHRLGQVFLVDQNQVLRILESASFGSTDDVVEIGCGHGALSKHLVTRCRALSIIEIDPECVLYVKAMLANEEVTYIEGDVLDVQFDQIHPKQFYLIANIPYYISAKIIKLIIQHSPRILEAVIMLQNEFADKLMAEPGSKTYTSLSVYSQFHLHITRLFKVSNTCFRPVPRVHSAVIKIVPRSVPPYDVDRSLFFAIIRSAFHTRRKTLKNALSNSPYLTLSPEFKNDDYFISHPNVRGEKLSIDDFYDVYCMLKNYFPVPKIKEKQFSGG